MTTPREPSTDVRTTLEAHAASFPFTCELSLRPLAAFWESLVARNDAVFGPLGRHIQTGLRENPELLEPIEDLALLARHRALVESMMAAVFSPATWEAEYAAALVPFRMRSFYGTPAFDRALRGPDGVLKGSVNVDESTAVGVHVLSAYEIVLRQIYGIDLGLDYPIVLSVPWPLVGFKRHFKLALDPRFIEVRPRGAVPPLPPNAAEWIREALLERASLDAIIPADQFVISGFAVLRAFDVTDHEVLSTLKRDLIDRESIVSSARFQTLQDKLRILFRRPELQFGLAAIEGDRVLYLNHGARTDQACIFANSVHHRRQDFAGTVYERAVGEGRPVIVRDLTTQARRTSLEELAVQHGVRALLVAPLYYQDELIGTLALKSPRPGDFDATHFPVLDEVLPLFSMAVKRSVDELEGRVQALIKEKCTAIHPVVEWRFRQAVFHELERQQPGTDGFPAEMEPIIFREVYPLYALADIRGSATERAQAIQADLLAQLALAGAVLESAHDVRQLPVLDHLAHRVRSHRARVEVSLGSGDETGIIAFLRREIEPLFDHLQTFGGRVPERIDVYRRALDPTLGAVYVRRKAFEESVTAISDEISAYLDLEEQAAQDMFPHYFEKQKTDGVDYTIYVGASLHEDATFNPLYLRNLRLWQLMVACGIAARVDRLKARLPVALDTTNLILVQHAPLAIRFRFDEKRFDVDGAYNARYEIIKRRIDKALIQGTTERLTQPGRIAIVYSQRGEAAEYRDYLEYLQQLGYLGSVVEDLEVEAVPGAPSMHALRVEIDLARFPADGPMRSSAIDVLTGAAG
jgi:GAF domain